MSYLVTRLWHAASLLWAGPGEVGRAPAWALVSGGKKRRPCQQQDCDLVENGISLSRGLPSDGGAGS